MDHRPPCRIGMIAVIAAVIAAFALPAQAQNALQQVERQLEMIRRETKLYVNPDVPADQRLLIDYGGSFASNFAIIDDNTAHSHTLREQVLTGYLRLDLDGVHQVFVRASTRYRDWNGGDAFDTHGDDWIGPDIERFTYRFDLQKYLAKYENKVVDYNVAVEVGRQLVHWGNGLTLSEELDAIVTTLSYQKWSLDVLAGRTRGDIFDFDASRPEANRDTKRWMYGGKLTYDYSWKHRPYGYVLYQHDSNDDPAGVIGTADYEYESWYIGFGSEGSITDRLLYAVEGVYQGGESASNVFAATQTREPIEAWAIDGRLDYIMDKPFPTRLSGEILLASGDSDRGHTSNTALGNGSGTEDTAFNGFGLINTGLAFAPDPSNLMMLRLGASANPISGKRVQTGTNVYFYGKMNENGNVGEVTDSDERYLGSAIDLYANWQITSDLGLNVRYGVFFPGDAVIINKDPRQFLFTSLVLAF